MFLSVSPLRDDKDTIYSFESYPFHKENVEVLKVFALDDMPNFMVYGVPGSGKRTLVQSFINHLFQRDIHRMKKVASIEIPQTATSSIHIQYLTSGYHFEIFLSEYGMYDRYVLTEFLTHIIQYKTIHKLNRVVVLHEFQSVSRETQMTLRRMMEVYSKQVRFILVCNTLSGVERAIQSRCCMIRVPEIPVAEIVAYTHRIVGTGTSFSAEKIIKHTKGNLSLIKWLMRIYLQYPAQFQALMASASRREKDTVKDTVKDNEKSKMGTEAKPTIVVKNQDDIPPMDMRMIQPSRIRLIVQLIQEANLQSVTHIREICYEYLLEHYPLQRVFRDIVTYFTSHPKVDVSKKYKLIEEAGKISANMCQIEYDLIAIELLALKIKNILFFH